MEQGRFAGWQSVDSGSEAVGPKPEAEKKNKQQKKASGAQASASSVKPKNEIGHKRPEDDRLTKALAFLAEREASEASPVVKETKKKSTETIVPGSEESGVETTHQAFDNESNFDTTAEYSVQTDKSNIEAASEASESDADELEKSKAKKDENEEVLTRDIPLNVLNTSEVIIPLQGNASIAERVILLDSAHTEGTDNEAEKEPLEYVSALPEAYRMQPEQQQQAHDSEPPVPPENLESVTSSIPEGPQTADTMIEPEWTQPIGEAPMVPVAETSRRLEPAEAYRLYTERDAAGGDTSFTAPAEEMVTKRSAEDAEYYAARAGQNRGLVTGLFVGALYEHFKHKRRERKAEKRFKEQSRQLKQARRDQHFYVEAQEKQLADNQRKLASTEDRLESTERRFEERVGADRNANQTSKSRSVEVLEKAYQTVKNQLAKVPEQRIVSSKNQTIEVPQQLAIPPEHRLETSAWHTIEVDSRTGKPVEQPAFTYGHEYYQERAQESTPTAQRNAVAGEIALTGASTGSGQSQPGASAGSNGSSPPSIPDASRQGAPPPMPKQKMNLKLDNIPNPLTSTGPIWPYILALLVIFACLVVLL